MSVPRLEIVVPLEGTPRLYVLADSDEDARALFAWLEAVDLEEVGALAAASLESMRRAA